MCVGISIKRMVAIVATKSITRVSPLIHIEPHSMCMRQRDITRAQRRDTSEAIRYIHSQLHWIKYQIPCRVCNKQFSRKRSDKYYCSSACRQKAYRMRQDGKWFYLTKNGYIWL